MFIFPGRGLAVIVTLTVLFITVMLTSGCATRTPTYASPASPVLAQIETLDCRKPLVQSCLTVGGARDHEICDCRSTDQLERTYGWRDPL